MRMFVAALALTLAPVPPALAQVAAAAVASVDLLDGWREPDGSRVAALEIALAPGWHTYWRVPGAAGIPPRFDWSGSENLEAVSYEWPRPEVFERYGLRTFGYDGTLVLPLRLRPRDPSAPLDLALDLDFGVCEDICVPASAQLAARLTLSASEEARAQIEAALAERPLTAAEAGVAAVTCGLSPTAQGYELTTEVTFAAAPADAPLAVLEPGQPDLWIGEPESRTEGRTVIARAPVEAAGAGGPVLERRALRVTLLDADRAVELRGCAARAEAGVR
jgi:DsbC/DsbD-like thiol-disulfide interchange protein